jgi:hypothetical protein
MATHTSTSSMPVSMMCPRSRLATSTVVERLRGCCLGCCVIDNSKVVCY